MKRVAVVFASLACICFALLVYAQERRDRDASFDTVVAKRFVLNDSHGRQRALIGVDADDVVRFSMGKGGPDAVFIVSVFPDGTAALILHDKRGVNAISMSVHPEGFPRVVLDSDAKVILEDSHFVQRAVVGMGKDCIPYLEVFDQRMRPVISRPPMPEATACTEATPRGSSINSVEPTPTR